MSLRCLTPEHDPGQRGGWRVSRKPFTRAATIQAWRLALPTPATGKLQGSRPVQPSCPPGQGPRPSKRPTTPFHQAVIGLPGPTRGSCAAHPVGATEQFVEVLRQGRPLAQAEQLGIEVFPGFHLKVWIVPPRWRTNAVRQEVEQGFCRLPLQGAAINRPCRRVVGRGSKRQPVGSQARRRRAGMVESCPPLSKRAISISSLFPEDAQPPLRRVPFVANPPASRRMQAPDSEQG